MEKFINILISIKLFEALALLIIDFQTFQDESF